MKTTELVKIRLERGASQEEVAASAGIARAAYTNIENCRRRPSPETAQKIAAFLDFDWTYFYTEWKGEYGASRTDGEAV